MTAESQRHEILGEDFHVLVQYQLIAALQEREHDLAEAQRLAHVGSWSWERTAGRLTWSDELHRILGVDECATPSLKLFLERVHPDDRSHVDELIRALWDEAEDFDVEHRLAANPARWVRTRGAFVRDATHEVVRVHGTVQDITDQQSARFALEALARHAPTGSHLSIESIVTLYGPDGTILLSTITRAMDGEDGHLRSRVADSDGWEEIHPDDAARMRDAVRRLLAQPGSTMSATYRLRGADGSWQLFEASGVNAAADGTLHGTLVSSYRIGATPVTTDPLTGLASHALLLEHMEGVVARAARLGWVTAVLAIDLDGFGRVNREHGHAAGDAVLVRIAGRLADAFRGSDVVSLGPPVAGVRNDLVGRFGGDRFIVVCENVPAGGADTLVARAREAVETPVALNGGKLISLTAGIGISIDGPEGRSAEERILDAERALREAKRQDTGPREALVDAAGVVEMRNDSINALAAALERGELVLHYQPKLSLESNEITGAEALLRWDDPARGLVPPLEFIDLAEESGLIVPIGEWVLREACDQVARWQRSFPEQPDLVVSVNVSPSQFAADLPSVVADALAHSGIAPHLLCLEVTESTLVEDLDAAAGILGHLGDLGVKLAIDDFGTGYSSLSYLRTFPLHELKIDKSFVDGLGDDSNDTAIVGATVAMAHALGLTVTAEGVETADQLDRLRVIGCQDVQGYYIARPQTVASFDGLLHERALGPWQPMEQRDASSSTDPYRPPKVLIVDDATEVRLLARMALGAAGFDVHDTGQPLDALTLARDLAVDCVILDISMPEISGFELVHALRADPVVADCTIIMLTANATADDKVAAYSGGADDYIIKPFSPRDLVSRVRAAIRARSEAASSTIHPDDAVAP